MTRGPADDEPEPDVAALLELVQAMRRQIDHGAGDVLRLSFDDETVRLWGRDAAGGSVLRAAFAWTSVIRVCFKDNGPLASDTLFLFTREHGSTLVVPLEADGGGDFWRHLPERGLFPVWLHERATLSTNGGLYCWPPVGRQAGTRGG